MFMYNDYNSKYKSLSFELYGISSDLSEISEFITDKIENFNDLREEIDKRTTKVASQFFSKHLSNNDISSIELKRNKYDIYTANSRMSWDSFSHKIAGVNKKLNELCDQVKKEIDRLRLQAEQVHDENLKKKYNATIEKLESNKEKLAHLIDASNDQAYRLLVLKTKKIEEDILTKTKSLSTHSDLQSMKDLGLESTEWVGQIHQLEKQIHSIREEIKDFRIEKKQVNFQRSTSLDKYWPFFKKIDELIENIYQLKPQLITKNYDAEERFATQEQQMRNIFQLEEAITELKEQVLEDIDNLSLGSEEDILNLHKYFSLVESLYAQLEPSGIGFDEFLQDFENTVSLVIFQKIGSVIFKMESSQFLAGQSENNIETVVEQFLRVQECFSLTTEDLANYKLLTASIVTGLKSFESNPVLPSVSSVFGVAGSTVSSYVSYQGIQEAESKIANLEKEQTKVANALAYYEKLISQEQDKEKISKYNVVLGVLYLREWVISNYKSIPWINKSKGLVDM